MLPSICHTRLFFFFPPPPPIFDSTILLSGAFLLLIFPFQPLTLLIFPFSTSNFLNSAPLLTFFAAFLSAFVISASVSSHPLCVYPPRFPIMITQMISVPVDSIGLVQVDDVVLDLFIEGGFRFLKEPEI